MTVTHFTRNGKGESIQVIYKNILTVGNELFSNRITMQYSKDDKIKEIKLPLDAAFLVTC